MKKERKEKRREEKEKQRQAEGKDKFREKDKNGGPTVSELVGPDNRCWRAGVLAAWLVCSGVLGGSLGRSGGGQIYCDRLIGSS